MRVDKFRLAIFTIFAIFTITLFTVSANAATFVVTNTNNSGSGSLRQAVVSANVAAGPDTIEFDTAGVFAVSQTITLATGTILMHGELTISGPGADRLTISGNHAGPVFYINFDSHMVIDGLTIADGYNIGFGGGGIWSDGDLTLTNSVVRDNYGAFPGGGIWGGTNTTLIITNSIISNNHSDKTGGGISNNGTVRLTNSTVSGNTAGNSGGGIHNAACRDIEIINSTISNNSATNYGGAIVLIGSLTSFSVIGSTISGNSAGEGGAVESFSSAPLTFTSSTIVDNRATVSGGGLATTGEFVLRSTIVAGNFLGSTPDDIEAPVVTASNTLIGDAASSAGVVNGVDGNIVGVNPLLGTLADNGGSTRTHALLPGSPAIDAGANPNSLATDQRGYQRNYDFAAISNGSSDGTDIGALELDPDTDGDGVRDFSDNCDSTPNPEKIVFSSGRDGNFEIYAMNADGSSPTRLTNNPAVDQDPSFSPDGSKIVFRSDRDGNVEIYVMNSDGTGQINLTNDPAEDSYPSFSPDGSKIVFTSFRDGNLEVYVMNADGTDQTNLTNHAAHDGMPAFSPDGSKIAFISTRDGNSEIYVMNSDGSSQTNLTNNAVEDELPTFSNDGSKIVFDSFRNGNRDIYLMNTDGTGQTNLSNSAASDFEPSFSPDGSKIVYYSLSAFQYEVYSMNSDGTNQINLSNTIGIDIQASWGRQADGDGDGIGDACENTAPTISPNVISRQQDAGSSNSVIATVGDGEDDLDDLVVTVGNAGSATVNGVTVSNISVDGAGNVTADVSAACGASSAMFDLKVSDSGGLQTTAILNVTVTNETTAPVIDPISNVTVYLPLNSPASSMVVNFPLPTATDNCSTPVVTTSPVSGSVFSIGTTTVNVTAKDALNNTSTATFTVKVLYNFGGFLQPVDPMPTLNIAQAGSSIPVKFSLSGNKGLGILDAGYPMAAPVACDQNEPGSQVEETASAGYSTLTYDAVSDQYKYVWKTNKLWKGTCWMLVVKLADDSEHYAKFRFK